MSIEAGVLYVVATPIGNLDDMTHRAEKILRDADAILCEDTRHSGKLLQHYGIKQPLVSLHEHNERERVAAVLRRLEQGQKLALISDAGTPLISDPGYVLVREARAAGHAVIPVPGASAVITALSAAGLPTDRFCFEGFLPPKSAARRERLQGLSAETRTLVFYESPRRLADMLNDVADIMGEDRAVVVARELTKLHEEFLRGSARELADKLQDGIKGECVVMIAGAAPEGAGSAESDALLRALLEELPASRAAKVAAKITGEPRKALFERATELAGKNTQG